MLRTIRATRYVTPLREGWSLPAIIEADDLGLYVLKFRCAGQGSLALVAELIAGEIGRALGVPNEAVVLRLSRTRRLTVYDASHLELAQREDVALATLDSDLIRAARAENVALI